MTTPAPRPLLDAETGATTLVVEPTPFERLIAAHVESYRPSLGGLVDPVTVTVVDPHHLVTTEKRLAHAAAQAEVEAVDKRGSRVMAVALAVSVLGSVGSLCADVMANGMLDSPAAGWSCVAFLLGPMPSGLVWWAFKEREGRAALALVDEPLRRLGVPADVGAAYRAYLEVPNQLRVAQAAEDTVGVIEGQIPHMEDLLVEAARLHRLDGSATEPALAVREQMVSLIAQAQSLVVLAQRHQCAIADAEASTALVLGRGPDPSTMSHLADKMIDDTVWVRGILDGDRETQQP